MYVYFKQNIRLNDGKRLYAKTNMHTKKYPSPIKARGHIQVSNILTVAFGMR